MDRRRFLSISALSAAAFSPASRLLAQPAPLPVHVSVGGPTGRLIAEDFTGLSYESAQLSDPNFFTSGNNQLSDLMAGLGKRGVLRIGGNTSEYCFWKTDPKGHTGADAAGATPDGAIGPDEGQAAPQRRVITEQAIHNLKSFLDRLPGWTLIYGLNLGLGTPEMAADEAAYVSRVMGDRLLAFQMANEPDVFFSNGLRPSSYNSQQFIEEWARFFKAVRRRVPHAPFAGPDTAYNNEWLVPFAKAFRNDLKFVSSHYYAEGPPTDPAMTLARLLRPDPKLEGEFAGLEQVKRETGLPFRLAETNSCYHGGKEGVSNTFAAALWAADYMFRIAQAGGIGVNFHGGGYGIYTPIAGTRANGFEARPIYYGMRLFREAAIGGQLLQVNPSTVPDGLRLYAVKRPDGRTTLTVLNLNLEHPVTVTVGSAFKGKRLIRMQAPSVSATTGETLGGAAISNHGAWHARQPETAGSNLDLPPASAALVG